MLDDEFAISQVKNGELKEVDTLAYKDDELFTYEAYCNNANI